MGTFKEDILQDISDVFANGDEFFEEHTVNGKKMLIMVDGDANLGRTGFQKSFHEGMQAEQVVVYVKASDFGRKPVCGSKVIIDKASFLVSSSANHCGMYSITLESPRGHAK